MSWETFIGLIYLGNIVGLLWASQIIKPSDASGNTQALLLNGLQLLFISVALIIGSIGFGTSRDVIEASLDNNNQANIDSLENTTDALYQGTIYSYLALVFFLLIIVVVTGMQGLRNIRKQRNDDRKFTP
jgi:hypothetical protein